MLGAVVHKRRRFAPNCHELTSGIYPDGVSRLRPFIGLDGTASVNLCSIYANSSYAAVSRMGGGRFQVISKSRAPCYIHGCVDVRLRQLAILELRTFGLVYYNKNFRGIWLSPRLCFCLLGRSTRDIKVTALVHSKQSKHSYSYVFA